MAGGGKGKAQYFPHDSERQRGEEPLRKLGGGPGGKKKRRKLTQDREERKRNSLKGEK